MSSLGQILRPAFGACLLIMTAVWRPGVAHACTVDPFAAVSDSQGPVTGRDLVTLVDFGQSGNSQDQESAVGVSPDGRRAALLVRRPDIAENAYCQAIVIVALDTRTAPLVIQIDAQPIIWAPDIRGLLTPNGSFVANPPRWTPDGRRLAFRAPVAGIPQVIVIEVATGEKQQLTSALGGVDDFAWSQNGTAIVYTTRADLPVEEAALDREARAGFHYDRRLSPMFALRPMTPGDLPLSYRAVALDTESDREASVEERAALRVADPAGRPPDAFAFAADGAGRAAWLRSGKPEQSWLSARTLTMKVANKETHCDAPTCKGQLFNVWLVQGAVIYLRREGWADSATAIYRWRPGRMPQRLLTTVDALLGCDITGSRLLCGRESSRRPRRLWSWDIATGVQQIVFDPNPGFPVARLARVERLHWRGLRGIEGYGDLVIPDGKPPRLGFPMIVVQYRTRGFLRGAIGDEYPIFAFAARGFAVLSLEEANFSTFADDDPASTTMLDAMRETAVDNGERRLQEANLEAAIQRVRMRIPVDMGRLGITGISDAASSAVFALAATNLFSAAALGTPVMDPSVLALGGHALQDQFRFMGYPPVHGDNDDFYRPLALTPNAKRLRLPLLFQWSDTEYLGGMMAVTALEEAYVPVDLYIFPGEYHVKFQPAHRLAVYERNLDWFDFWFNGREAPDVAKRAQFAHWRALRDQACAIRPVPQVPAQLCSQASTSTSADKRE